MTKLKPLLKFVLASPRDATVYECRRCGASVEDADADCPYCGDATGIVHYELD